MQRPLDGITVVDLSTGVAGPFCTKLLAGFGARVIKVEPPGGDDARRTGPFATSVDGTTASVLFAHLNAGKESVVLDLDDSEDRLALLGLVEGSDILVESSVPGDLAKLGLQPESLWKHHADLVVTSITPFGQTGPYAGFAATEIVGYAMGGPMNATGTAEREPVKILGNAVQMQAGNTALTVTLAAYLHARRTGQGDHVDVAWFETQNGSTDRRRYYHVSYQYSGTTTARGGKRPFGGRFEASDGRYVAAGPLYSPADARRMLDVLGDEELDRLFADEGFHRLLEERERIDTTIAEWVSNRTALAAMREAQEVGWAIALVNDPWMVQSYDHLQQRGYWRTVRLDGTGDLPACGPPWRVFGGGWELGESPPALGADTERVRGELPLRHEHGRDASGGWGVGRETGYVPGFGPLEGLRVLDLTVALAGGHTTMLLADLGAEVIKIESLQHYSPATRGSLDPAPTMSVLRDYVDCNPYPDPWHRVSLFNSHGRNKLSMTVDLGDPDSRERILRLVEASDGVVENNAPGTLEKLGLGPDVLLERNPALVVVRMPAMGLTGPDRHVIGYGWMFEELAGITSLQGYADGELVNAIHMDAASGPAGASGFLMGLLLRRRTDSGGVVEVAQIENLLHHVGDVCLHAATLGRCPERLGNRDRNFVPQGAYPCAGGEDEWIVLSVRDDEDWERLKEVLGRPAALDEATFDHAAGRWDAHDEIDAAISSWTEQRTRGEAFRTLQAGGVAAGPVLDEAGAFEDEHLQGRGFFHLLEHPSAGSHFYPGATFQLLRRPPVIWRAAPLLGHDNEYVYRQLLGTPPAVWDDLIARGEIGEKPGIGHRPMA